MNVHFVVTLGEKDMAKAEEQGLLEFFKLTSKINTSNMMAFDFDGKIKKYSSPEEIIEDFYPVRLAWYQKRKVCGIDVDPDPHSRYLIGPYGWPASARV